MTSSEYYRWLKKDWAKTGFMLAIFLFVFLTVLVRRNDFVLFILLVQTPLYMLHQTDEYIFPGGLGKYFYTEIFQLRTKEGPVDEKFIFFVNILLIWIVLPVCGLLSTIDYRNGLWIPYFTFFAGIGHIVLAMKARKVYSPGLVVSLLVNIPVGLWSIVYLIQAGILKNGFFDPHILIGLGVNVLLPVMGVILFRNYRKLNAIQQRLQIPVPVISWNSLTGCLNRKPI